MILLAPPRDNATMKKKTAWGGQEKIQRAYVNMPPCFSRLQINRLCDS